MLAFFHSWVSCGPEELRSPTSRKGKWKSGSEMMDSFVEARADAVCLKVADAGAMAFSHHNQALFQPRCLACVDDIFCIFVGCLDNLAVLRRQYGLCMNAKEDMLVIEAYRALRDRSPYPPDQVLKDLNGTFAFVLYDASNHTIFAVWLQLSEAAWAMFVEFENAIQRDSAKIPVPGGALHPLTRYVMNYMRFTCDYKETLEQILGDGRVEDPRMPDRSASLSPDDYKNSGDELSPWSIQIIWIIELLEDNLDAKSKLYKDPSLSYLFLMNNCRYIVQKVKDSEIGCLVGDDWVRKHATKVRQYHKNYQRAAWGKVLSCLKDEGICVSGNFSSSVSKAVLKERFKNFNDLFEQIHKVQSSWTVTDDQLQTELRISIAEMVIPAYRSFLGRFRQFLENGKHSEKYIKYTPEDLEIYINELFEGISGSMGRRKASANN